MKFRKSYLKWLLIGAALLASFGFAACGGTSGAAGGGIGGTGKAIGAVVAVDSGSATVNGVTFVTSTATVSIDDSPGSESDLKPGMVVEIEGEFNDDGTTGSAVTVSSSDVVEGPVTAAVSTTERSLEVMGQVVFYTATTVFENTGLLGGGNIAPTDLNIGNVVEVYGLVDSAGQVKATRVERKAVSFTSGDVLEVNGLVANLDTTAETFSIGALDISYAATTTFDNGTVNDLADGVLVEVKGDDDPTNGLEADKIEFKTTDFGDDGDLLQFEGVVSSIAPSVGDFEVNGLPVVTSGSTQWRGGYTGLGDVHLDDRVEVDGTLEDQGGTLVLVAREVELEVEEEVRFEAFVDSIQASTNVVTLLGIDVTYSDSSSLTEFEDRDGVITAIDDLVPGHWISLRSYIDSDGNLVATRIEKDNGDADPDRIILRGPAANVPASPGNFSILGVTIDISSMSDSDYRIEDSPSNEVSFFNNLTHGRIVKGRGSLSGNTLTVEELDLEN
jgi:hypothetical protein